MMRKVVTAAPSAQSKENHPDLLLPRRLERTIPLIGKFMSILYVRRDLVRFLSSNRSTES